MITKILLQVGVDQLAGVNSRAGPSAGLSSGKMLLCFISLVFRVLSGDEVSFAVCFLKDLFLPYLLAAPLSGDDLVISGRPEYLFISGYDRLLVPEKGTLLPRVPVRL